MSYLRPNIADLASASQPVAAPPVPDSYFPAQPGTSAVVIECAWLAYDGAEPPTVADVRCDYPTVFAWRVRPPTAYSMKLSVEPVLAYSPSYANVPGQGAVVEVLVPDDNTPGSPLRSRRHNRISLDEAKRAVLAEARSRWRRERRRIEVHASRKPVVAAPPALELLAA